MVSEEGVNRNAANDWVDWIALSLRLQTYFIRNQTSIEMQIISTKTTVYFNIPFVSFD